ncbi:MAG TPA: response regulator transcription factor [Myxococcaceae bacterium]|jgi:DNA-binding NarL/FixJ family response regulator
MIRILLADARDLFRAGLSEILRKHPGFEVCAEATSADEAVHLATAAAPDVVILGGVQHLSTVAGAAEAGAVLLLANEPSPALAQRAFELGAGGYLLVSDSGERLIAAVASVAARERYTSPQVPAGPPAGSPLLTARENAVLELVVAGQRTREIAELLKISTKTVETHRGAIMRKLQLHRLAEVVRYAVQNDLCAPRS